jgi:hypothetical protein
MVRLAPSASNKQPWRCLKVGPRIHFFLLRSPGYRTMNPADFQRIDMGIAMAHFDLAMAVSGVAGLWRVFESSSSEISAFIRPAAWQRCEYLVSWGTAFRGTACRGTACRGTTP